MRMLICRTHETSSFFFIDFDTCCNIIFFYIRIDSINKEKLRQYNEKREEIKMGLIGKAIGAGASLIGAGAEAIARGIENSFLKQEKKEFRIFGEISI